MRHLARALLLPSALVLTCAHCARPVPIVPSPDSLVAAAAPASMGWVEAGGGVRLLWRTVGIPGTDRDTIVVLHGGPGLTMDYLLPDLAPLAARHVLLFFDQRGAGGSTLATDAAALDGARFADDLEAVRRQFGMEQLTLLGHSWGAGVAALYAARHPERVRRLLIVDAIPATRPGLERAFDALNRRRDGAEMQRMLELGTAREAKPGDAATCRALVATWFRPAYADSTMSRRVRGDFCAGSPEALANSLRSVGRYTFASLGDWDWRSSLRVVPAPSLVVHGAMDFIPLQSSREWAAALPNSRLLVLSGSGHFPYVEVPDRFFGAVEEFLQGRWPAGSETVSVSTAR